MGNWARKEAQDARTSGFGSRGGGVSLSPSRASVELLPMPAGVIICCANPEAREPEGTPVVAFSQPLKVAF